MKNKFIIISSLIIVGILYTVEQYLMVNYLFKTLSKIILFIIIPYIYIKYVKKKSIKNALNLKGMNKKQFSYGIIFGILCFIIVIIAYLIFKKFIDFKGILNEMQNKSQITPANFIFVGLYITFVNSFLEEYFFRGYIFLNLYEKGNKIGAYIFSSLLFSLYHLTIFKSWFDLQIMFLVLFGLFSVGILFNILDTKSRNFINSWIVHILADSAIILIGCRLFNMI